MRGNRNVAPGQARRAKRKTIVERMRALVREWIGKADNDLEAATRGPGAGLSARIR